MLPGKLNPTPIGVSKPRANSRSSPWVGGSSNNLFLTELIAGILREQEYKRLSSVSQRRSIISTIGEAVSGFYFNSPFRPQTVVKAFSEPSLKTRKWSVA